MDKPVAFKKKYMFFLGLCLKLFSTSTKIVSIEIERKGEGKFVLRGYFAEFLDMVFSSGVHLLTKVLFIQFLS